MATPVVGQIHFRKRGQASCVNHKGRQLELYCKKCDTLICLKCFLTIHKGHAACELSDITPTKKQDIQNFIDRTEQNDLVQLREYITSADTLLKDNNSNFEKLSNKLKMQTDQMKLEIDLLTEQTLAIYRKMEKDNTKLIQKYKQDLEMYDKQLRQQIQECKTVLQHGSHIEIYDTGCEISTYSNRNIPVKPVLETASFTPNKNLKPHLELALGKIDMANQGQASVDCTSIAPFGNQQQSNTQNQSGQKRPEDVGTYKLQPQTKVLEEWESPVYIDSVCPTTEDQAWTSFWDSNTLTLLNRKGNVIQQVKHKTNINNISLSPTKHTLCVCDTENNIMELVSGGLKHRFTTTERPMCICVTANDHIIVGMTNRISKFTTQGQMVLTTSAAGTGKPLVCSPYRISECPITHNVAVVDKNNKGDGGDGIPHVIAMDTDFKKLFVYRGNIPSAYKQSSHKIARPFNPLGMVYDSMGNISIVDYSNDRVLLISGRGEFLSIIHTDIFSTFAVGVDREDVLWTVLGLFCGRDVKLLQYSSV